MTPQLHTAIYATIDTRVLDAAIPLLHNLIVVNNAREKEYTCLLNKLVKAN